MDTKKGFAEKSSVVAEGTFLFKASSLRIDFFQEMPSFEKFGRSWQCLKII
jgi:hypothetical protein